MADHGPANPNLVLKGRGEKLEGEAESGKITR